jgi:serine/threonine-protein kinase
MLKQVDIDIEDALIFLPGIRLFIKLDNKVISDIAKRMSLHRYQAGEHLIRQGAPGEYMLIIKQGKVKLMDFGIATTSSEVRQNFEGTLLYTAPEVLQKKPFDYRIDIYALGVTAFAMLTGKTPFRAPTILGIVEKTINKEAADIKTLVPDVPDGLAEFIRRALVKDPAQRISSWSEIQSLLAPGKGSKFDLLANSDMDMAVVVKLKTHAIDTELLLKEIHQVLKVHHASY